VQTHTHADRPARQRVARIGGGRERIGRPCERDEECIALRVHLHTAVPSERPTQGATVLSQNTRILVTELVQQPRRPLDVGEQEGDGACGQLGHTGMMRRSRPEV
jgi:hypothetical protein